MDQGLALGVQSILNVGAVVAVGKWALLKFDQHRDQYARDREQDAKANWEARDALRNEMHAIEGKVMTRVEQDVDLLASNVRQLDRNVDRVLDVVRGSEFNPGGLVAQERRATQRRHAILNNLSIIDAKLLLLTEMMLTVARNAGVTLPRSDVETLMKPIRWDLSEDDAERA